MVQVKIKDKKLYNLLKELIRLIAGRNSEAILDILFQKKNINEFKIASKLGITINQTRNIIYKISNFNILNSIRKKDKKKGWYTYFWTLDNVKALNVLAKFKIKEIRTMYALLKTRRLKNFYLCAADNIEMTEETAMHYGFLCPECGKLLEPISKEKKIREMTIRIEKTKRELRVIKEELERITPKPKLKIKKKKKKPKKYKKKTKKKKKGKKTKKKKKGKKTKKKKKGKKTKKKKKGKKTKKGPKKKVKKKSKKKKSKKKKNKQHKPKKKKYKKKQVKKLKKKKKFHFKFKLKKKKINKQKKRKKKKR